MVIWGANLSWKSHDTPRPGYHDLIEAAQFQQTRKTTPDFKPTTVETWKTRTLLGRSGCQHLNDSPLAMAQLKTVEAAIFLIIGSFRAALSHGNRQVRTARTIERCFFSSGFSISQLNQLSMKSRDQCWYVLGKSRFRFIWRTLHHQSQSKFNS